MPCAACRTAGAFEPRAGGPGTCRTTCRLQYAACPTTGEFCAACRQCGYLRASPHRDAMRRISNGRYIFSACRRSEHILRVGRRRTAGAFSLRAGSADTCRKYRVECRARLSDGGCVHRFGGRVIDGHPGATACCSRQERGRGSGPIFPSGRGGVAGRPKIAGQHPPTMRDRTEGGDNMPVSRMAAKRGSRKVAGLPFRVGRRERRDGSADCESESGTARAETAVGATSARGSAADTPHRTA